MAGKGEREQLIERILELEERLFRAVGPYKQWLGLNFTMPQLKTLLLLFTDGPTRMGALSARLGVSLATTTGIVERLVKQGVVRRENQPGDRRVVICKLTPKGEKMMGRLWESKQIWARSLLEKMSLSKLQSMAEAMDAILEAVTEAITTAKEEPQQAITLKRRRKSRCAPL